MPLRLAILAPTDPVLASDVQVDSPWTPDRLLPSGAVLLICLLLLVIRPVAALLGLVGSDTNRLELGLTRWFGIRGIGSIYYLSCVIGHGLPADLAKPVVAVALATVTISVVAYGLSATPIISGYFRHRRASEGRDVLW